MTRLLGMLALVASSCVEQPTQVLVRIATDIPDIRSVTINIYDHDGELVREAALAPQRLDTVPPDGRFHPVGTFGLVPQDGDATRRFRVVLDVAVEREGRLVRFETRARSGFVRRNTIRLDIFIAELCIELAAMCEEEGLTCGIDGCVPEDVPPESLPPIDDDPIPDDPIDPRRHDAGVRDTGVDGAFDAMLDSTIDVAVDTTLDTATDGPIDAGVDANIDAPVGMDAGGFDGGTLVPWTDDAPIVFPWGGFRFEGTSARVAFREIPGAAGYTVALKSGSTTVFQEVFVEPGSGTGILVGVVPDVSVPLGGRRLELQVRSCDDTVDLRFDCTPPAGRPRYIELGRVRCDLDNDGVSDVISTQDDGTLSIWVDGPGSLPDAINPHSGTSPTVAACADLDGDGAAEVVTLRAASALVRIVRWTGSPSATSAGFSAAAETIVAGDFDSDGFEDVVWANPTAGTVQWSRGGAGPSLASPSSIARHPELVARVSTAAGRYGRDLAVADVDADGYLDVIISDANHRDVPAQDSGLQICYGGPTPFDACSFVPVPAPGEHFGASVAGLGISAEGRGGFVVGAPEADLGTGGVYEYRSGAGSPVYRASPAMARGFCCFPNDLAPGPRDYDSFRYYVGYGDYETNSVGRTYECTEAGCAAIAAPGAVDAYFGFDVMGDLSTDRFVALSRAGGQNGVYVYDGSWTRALGSPVITPESRLAD